MHLSEVHEVDRISSWTYFLTTVFGASFYIARCTKHGEDNKEVLLATTDALLSVNNSCFILTDVDNNISGITQRKPCIIKKLSNKVEPEWEKGVCYYTDSNGNEIRITREYSSSVAAWSICISLSIDGEVYTIIGYTRNVNT